jgi:hypothetical protein
LPGSRRSDCFLPDQTNIAIVWRPTIMGAPALFHMSICWLE